MELKNQVCTIEQAKRLNQLGVSYNESYFRWYEVSDGSDEGDLEKEGVDWFPTLCQYNRTRDADISITKLDSDLTTSDGEFCSHKGPYPALTVAELGELLIVGDDTHFIDCHYNEHLGCWNCNLSKRSEIDTKNPHDSDSIIEIIHGASQEAETEAECRAEMLIYLLEKKIITASNDERSVATKLNRSKKS